MSSNDGNEVLVDPTTTTTTTSVAALATLPPARSLATGNWPPTRQQRQRCHLQETLCCIVPIHRPLIFPFCNRGRCYFGSMLLWPWSCWTMLTIKLWVTIGNLWCCCFLNAAKCVCVGKTTLALKKNWMAHMTALGIRYQWLNSQKPVEDTCTRVSVSNYPYRSINLDW